MYNENPKYMPPAEEAGGEPLKTCAKCGERKPANAFHVRRRSKGGRRARCKECACADSREWYRTHPDYQSQRIDYSAKMRLRKRRPDLYMRWMRIFKSMNEQAARRGAPPTYVGTGQVARDVVAYAKTGRIEG